MLAGNWPILYTIDDVNDIKTCSISVWFVFEHVLSNFIFLMDFNKFSNYLKENNFDLEAISKGTRSFSITANGTYAKGSELFIENCSLIFSSTDEKNSLTIMKKKREIEKFENTLPLMDFNCTYVQFFTDSFFFSPNSTALAQISLLMSVL